MKRGDACNTWSRYGSTQHESRPLRRRDLGGFVWRLCIGKWLWLYCLAVLGAPGSSVFSASLEDIDWTLAGIDIFGNKTVGRDEILALVPMSVGRSLRPGDGPARNRWCAELKSKYNFVRTECAVILIQPSSAYMSIDVVEKGEEWRLSYAQGRWMPGRILDPSLRRELRRFRKLQEQKFAAGVAIMDIASQREFVDFEEPDLHRMAVSLYARVPAYRKHLLDVVAYGELPADRADAAFLLDWAGQPQESAERVYEFLDDPDESVRNNISRFLIKFAPIVQDAKVRERIVRALASQLDRPTALDRNKALFALNALVSSDASLAPLVAELACDRAQEIARLSVMPNVGGEARRLLSQLQPPVAAGAQCPHSFVQ